MKVGYVLDARGLATYKCRIVAETTNGRYVVDHPIECQRGDGSKFLAQDPNGLMIVSKLFDIHEEEL